MALRPRVHSADPECARAGVDRGWAPGRGWRGGVRVQARVRVPRRDRPVPLRCPCARPRGHPLLPSAICCALSVLRGSRPASRALAREEGSGLRTHGSMGTTGPSLGSAPQASGRGSLGALPCPLCCLVRVPVSGLRPARSRRSACGQWCWHVGCSTGASGCGEQTSPALRCFACPHDARPGLEESVATVHILMDHKIAAVLWAVSPSRWSQPPHPQPVPWLWPAGVLRKGSPSPWAPHSCGHPALEQQL